MAIRDASTATDARKTEPNMEDEIAYLAKRHRVSPAIVREIVRRSGATERGAIEREIEKGKARR
jgi:beta-galactosidase/beta-glucuronidase